MQKRRVVVTGMGCLTPVGNTINQFWNSILSGKSGVSEITSFDAQDMPVKFSASIKDFDVEKYLDIKEQRKMDLFMQYGMAAGIDAISDSGINDEELDRERIGISIRHNALNIASITEDLDKTKSAFKNPYVTGVT